ncbi:ATP-binding cassette domain-containing protein [Sphingomicrobium nitratireducens]|uniref:ATP-binding cassette domain-containing protein n=1 Tax=Sphingomicrobium nitratireducens TaxID=2964666 RepID=UPI00223F4551|nr:hypothetical protein [Sphingomicrobium nitratireducens]
MIGFDRVSMAYVHEGFRRQILRDATLLFEPHEKVCVMAPAGSGKTTIAHLMAGFAEPQKGHVLRDARLSWPIGFSGVMHPAISGADNVEIIADLAGVPRADLLAYVMEFSGLGEVLDHPLQTYSSTMRGQLATSLSIAMPAQTYVVDTVVGSGSPSFRAKAEVAFERKLENAGMFFITSAPRQAEKYGEKFYVLEEGQFEPVASFVAAKAWLESANQREDDLSFVLDGFFGI